MDDPQPKKELPKILHDWDPSLNSQLNLPFEKRDPRLEVLIDFGGLRVWEVEGKDVREGYEIDFTEGGNAAKYEFIPVDEIWLDDWLTDANQANELWPTLLHELTEYKLMGAGGMPYADAHKEASIVEMNARLNPIDIHKLVYKAAHEAMDALGIHGDMSESKNLKGESTTSAKEKPSDTKTSA